MALTGFADSGTYTKADADRKRELAKQLMGSTFRARNPLGALAMGLEGAASGSYDKQASEAERAGSKLVAELLQNKDYAGVMGNEWSSPQQSALASMLQGRDWQVGDRNAQWAREDARFAQQQAAANRPDYSFVFAPDGTLLRTDKSGGSFENMGQFGKQDPPDPTTLMQNLEAAGIQPGSTEFRDAILKSVGGGVNINNMGNIPPGYTVQYDAANNPISMTPIPGSEADQKAKQAASQAALAQENKAKGAGIVVEDVNRAVDLINKDPALTTGFVGSLLKNVGGLSANNVSSLIDTIKANSAFDQLQAMRQASPTGGALGAVSDTENRMLQSAIGSLEQSQTPDQLVYNLRRVQRIYGDIVNGPGQGGTEATPDYKSKYGLE